MDAGEANPGLEPGVQSQNGKASFNSSASVGSFTGLPICGAFGPSIAAGEGPKERHSMISNRGRCFGPIFALNGILVSFTMGATL